MAKYTILGMMREASPSHNSVLISVAFRDNETDEDDYFMCTFYAEQMQYTQDFQYDLCVYAEQVAGSELAYQLKRYLHTKANPWSGTMVVESLNYVTHEPFLWSEIISKDPMMPAFKTVTKKKISFTGPYDHGGPIAPAKAYTSGPDRAVSQLPGLNVRVKHPGEMNNGCHVYDDNRLRTLIIHMNDVHQWTREQIADWLDEISDPTGETGPDLRFGAESAKVDEPKNPCEEVALDGWKDVGHTSNHTGFKGLEPYQVTVDEHYGISAKNLHQMHMHIELKDINPEIIKLMIGESNEQD